MPPPDGGDWRPGQQDVAAAVFARDRDMLAVLPTGYGKTAAFTYALQFESDAGDGLTVIVVPTNTIKQQVLQQLREAGVHAVAFGDKLPKRRNAQQLAGLAAGAFRVAVVSPEHLVPGSQVLAALMAVGVARFIIDEVHTVDDWEYIDPPPMAGALADLKVWVMDTGEPELEAEFRKLLGLMRRNGISDERVNAVADELYALVCQRQREEYEACNRAASDNGDFESWLHGQTSS
ncbi:hypothetical protein AUM41_01150 [Cronobacter malonaticus]|nr:hypothetical protein [Cronobacter malonaticus]EGT4420490.1 hypothetical protein [Cronobacter malonaticus]EGT4452895.1 hypothetical protein [Cronobacter malonaticus]